MSILVRLSPFTAINGYSSKLAYKYTAKTSINPNIFRNTLSNQHRTYFFDKSDRLILYKLMKRGVSIPWNGINPPIEDLQKILATDNKEWICQKLFYIAIMKGATEPLKTKITKADTSLHFAVKEKKVSVIKGLINDGANVNARGIGGKTPLFTAVRTGKPELVNLLMSSGADPAICETSAYNYNYTAFHEALMLNFFEITRLFVETWGVPADQPVEYNDYGWPPESMQFAMPSSYCYKNLTPHKRKEAEKILVFLLNNIGKGFIREKEYLFKKGIENNMHDFTKLMIELGHAT